MRDHPQSPSCSAHASNGVLHFVKLASTINARSSHLDIASFLFRPTRPVIQHSASRILYFNALAIILFCDALFLLPDDGDGLFVSRCCLKWSTAWSGLGSDPSARRHASPPQGQMTYVKKSSMPTTGFTTYPNRSLESSMRPNCRGVRPT